PFALPDSDGYFWVKGNLHCHTTNSDGRVAPQERLDQYVAQGYDFLSLTDHRKITRVDSVDVPDDFVLIQGAELHPANPFGGQVHHFVCLNIHEDMACGTMPPQHVIDNVNKQGGQVWLAHPHWSSINIIRDTLPLKGFTGIEVFNSTCRFMGRGEGSVHWDDWMSLEDRVYPCLANDDTHGAPEDSRDTYESWTMARVKERTTEAVLEALATGASYGSTGPEIHSIEVTRDGDATQMHVKCSEARRIHAVTDTNGTEYRESGELFTEADFALRKGAKWVRLEISGPQGDKAWSNPVDLRS
ncbi:MAG: CehA/McbA family metallohydrolase, partial [Candidatus Latescibacterota bacterium]